MSRVFRVFFLFILAGAVLTACQSLPFRSPEANLKQRATGLMNAKVNQDWAAFYTYLDPAYQKKVPQNKFVNRKRDVRFTDFSIKSVQIAPSGKDAEVAVVYDMTVRSYEFTDQRQVQDWVKKGGQWYLDIRQTNPLGEEQGDSPPPDTGSN